MNFEEARLLVQRAIRAGVIRVPEKLDLPPKPPPRQRRPRKGRRPKAVITLRGCPACERTVRCVDGKMARHRSREDSRGYGTGAWCDHREV